MANVKIATPHLYSVIEAAALTGRQHITIRKLAQRASLGPQPLGFKLPGLRGWLFTDADLDRIRAKPAVVGRPATLKPPPPPKKPPGRPRRTKEAPDAIS